MRELQQKYRAEQLHAGQKKSTRFAVGSIELGGIDEPDFPALFRHMPGYFVATRPDLTILAVSDDLLRKTFTWRENIIDRSIFEVFPENPSEKNTQGARALEASLRGVIASRMSSSVHVLRYDIQDRTHGDAGWIEKFWSAMSRPVVDRRTGEVLCVLTEARDVTRTVQLALWIDSRQDLTPEMQRCIQRVRSDVQGQAPDISSVRARIDNEMGQTGATPQVLVNELKALLRSPENRIYSCAGEWVTDAGVYVAYHRAGCFFARRVRYFAEGVMLPSCETCGSDVLYRFSHALS